MSRGCEELDSDRQIRQGFEAIKRTNQTGLGSREDYQIAFGPVAAEQRQEWLGWVPFVAVLSAAGVELGALGVLVMCKPDESLPEEIGRYLQHVNEVVDATPLQVLHARETGGPDVADFSVKRRIDLAILALALGDADALAVRSAAWTWRAGVGWVIARGALSAAKCFGLTKDEYISFSADPGVGLPPIDSPAAGDARAADKAGGRLVRGAWLSFASLADLASSA